MVDPNTRQGKRTPVTLKIKFKSETLEQFIERYAVDVSQGGIFIRTKEPLAVGTQMKFEFQLRDASPLIAGEGTVVWTRENDPSRPAIAPGMGVRFDRLADGSQGILERILTEKAKQAPQRPASDTARPPLFTDTPTRVAPVPVQDALMGKDRQRRPPDDPDSQHTPLPKPMPFHSDADEFPEEAFEEATKVRALDELIAQTAGGAATADELTAQRNGRGDSMASDPAHEPNGAAPSHEAQEADLSPPPEAGARPQPKLLDTSPSPRIEANQPAFVSEALAQTRLGVEPARARVVTPAPPALPFGQPATELPPMPSPIPSGMRAVATEQTEPARLPAAKPTSIAPILILIVLLVAAGSAAVWFLVLRPRQTAQVAHGSGSESASGTTPGSAVVATGPATTGGGSAATPGSTTAGQTGSAGQPASTAPKAELVDTVIAASTASATVEIVGANQSGPAPFTAKLEKGKPYKARVAAPTFLALTLDIKGGDDKQTVKLVAKPRVISVKTDPTGALIFIDSSATGHATPFDVELTEAQAAKKTVRVKIKKSGFVTIDRVVEIAKLTEDDARMVTTIDEKLVAPTALRAGSGAGSAKGPPNGGSDGDSGSTPDNSTPPSGGSAAPPTPPPAAPPAPPAGGTAGSSEPEPAFNKPS